MLNLKGFSSHRYKLVKVSISTTRKNLSKKVIKEILVFLAFCSYLSIDISNSKSIIFTLSPIKKKHQDHFISIFTM